MPRLTVVRSEADVEQHRVEHGALTPAEAFQVFDRVRAAFFAEFPGLYVQTRERVGCVETECFTTRGRGAAVSVAIVRDYSPVPAEGV